jgi:two-component system chemotaxis response regulator CheB
MTGRSTPAPRGALPGTEHDPPVANDNAPRVVVVDDSAAARARITAVLEEGGCRVVGRAFDGAMALRLVTQNRPDVIVCDLEMPGMDGLTFLRILGQMSRTPVVVLTAHGESDMALAALEAGACEVINKPLHAEEFELVGTSLVQKIRALHRSQRRARRLSAPAPDVELPTDVDVVILAASTGGPRAVREILGRLREPPRMPVVIAQHMAAGLTAEFATRLARATALDVAEALGGAVLCPGQVRVAPGGTDLVLERVATGLRLRVLSPEFGARWTPSIDALFSSAAQACEGRVLGVVLTGMGRDGAVGARALHAAGAPLWAESPSTAGMEGMPTAAAAGHQGAVVLPLPRIATALSQLLSQPKSGAPGDVSKGGGR